MSPEQTKRWIWSQCEECGDCLLWRGAVDSHGTPMMRKGQPKTDSVRRVLVRALGRNPNGKIATTRCGNKLCMAEGHVVLWTRKQLQQRSMGKKAGDVAWGLAVRRGREPTCKLSMEAARNIRAEGLTARQVMERYGVSEFAAYSVIRGRSWKDYSNPFAGLGA